MPVKVDVNANTLKWGAIVLVGIWFVSSAGSGISNLFGSVGNLATGLGNAINGATNLGNGIGNGLSNWWNGLMSPSPATPDYSPGPAIDPFNGIVPGTQTPTSPGLTPEQMWNFETQA